MLAHGRDGPEHQLLTANTLERLLHFTQEQLELEGSGREAGKDPGTRAPRVGGFLLSVYLGPLILSPAFTPGGRGHDRPHSEKNRGPKGVSLTGSPQHPKWRGGEDGVEPVQGASMMLGRTQMRPAGTTKHALHRVKTGL